MLTKELEGHSFKYQLFYKEWSAVALNELLKLPDDFFLEDEAGTDGLGRCRAS